MRLSRTVRRIASLGAACVVGPILLEGFARLAEWTGYGSEAVVEAKARDEDVLKALRSGRYPFPERTRSILVLGDSMAASIGVRQEEVWSSLLARKLREQVDPGAAVVNAAVPGANTYKELLLARELLPRLKPEVVLVMYNANDVYGTHDIITDPPPPPGAAIPPRPSPGPGPGEVLAAIGTTPVYHEIAGSPVARAIRYLKTNSRSLALFLPRFNVQLKARGILMPGTEYHHMATQAYRDDYDGWQRTRLELLELRKTCERHQAKLIVYVLPEFDSLIYDHSAAIRAALIPHFASIGVPPRFGYDHFKGRDAAELVISPFDCHPNPRNNREIAEEVLKWLGKTGAFARRPAVGMSGSS